MPFIDAVGHLSFLIVALSLLMRDIILLRLLGILSGLVGVGYNYFVTVEPLWVPIIWLSVFMLINIYMIATFFVSNRETSLSEADLALWKTNFLGLAIEEYKRLKSIFEYRSYGDGEVLIHAGRENGFLYFVTSGQLSVRRDGAEIGKLHQGGIVGEMSFLTKAPPNADVLVNGAASCILIDKARLRAMMMKHPSFHLSMTNLFNMNLMKKLAA
ncbi:MAG: cyclic nucleotide-binding domain-containing protein [Alphaproteobacteria bacterium]|jgi:hypothetical protein|nr:cyclic nucleotide-binding domain-containing protein [Alphaproteobacteria bacterium]MDP6830536.1 cyclic nucleotide-binding domain-containing protein [Alphaproteobacteria bacterium]MDP6873235.1 cyclic nucleotide-binding domain-containing protein [Alphaproteobacteria bacterium]